MKISPLVRLRKKTGVADQAVREVKLGSLNAPLFLLLPNSEPPIMPDDVESTVSRISKLYTWEELLLGYEGGPGVPRMTTRLVYSYSLSIVQISLRCPIEHKRGTSVRPVFKIDARRWER